MEANMFLSYVCLLFLSISEIPTVHLEKENGSKKDVILKDDDFSPLSIIELRQKTNSLDGEMEQSSQKQTNALQKIDSSFVGLQNSLSSLGNQLNDLNDEVAHLSLNQNGGLERLEQSHLEQNKILQKLDSNFVGLENLMFSLDDRLNDIEKLGTANQPENSFATSIDICGGLLVGRSGLIKFSKNAQSNTKYPSSCVWTVRANNYALIKVSTHPTYRTTYSNYISSSYVLEVTKNVTNGNTTRPQTLQTKIIKLQSSMHHVFAGPIIFIVTSLQSQNDIDLHLQFEGIGKMVERDVSFTHETLFANLGNFSSNELEYWTPSLLAKLDDNFNSSYTMDYTTIVISNFSAKVHLKVVFDEAGCSDGESFIVITDITDNDSTLTDCCQTRCEGNNSLINYNHPVVILITKKFRKPLNFTVAWLEERMYPSSSNSNLQCGGILGGMAGSIRYKPNEIYENNQRCVWVIIPQPIPTRSVIIEVNENGIRDKFDLLYIMELTDVNGDELSNSPRITRIGTNGTYVARSREVYVVFYSDSTLVGSGFSLTWRVDGDYIRTGNYVATQFTIVRSNKGSTLSGSEMINFASSFYGVFILTPEVPSSYTYGLELHLNKTVADVNHCIHTGFSIFTPVNGILSNTLPNCNNSSELVLENGDGIAIIVIHSAHYRSEMGTDFNWITNGNSNTTEVVVQDNHCGGIIKAEKGLLNYKAGVLYSNNELCIWVIHSPNDRGITLKLLQDEFEVCCDYLLVSTMNSSTETVLRSSEINRANNAQVFDESVLIISFRSDGSNTGKGFVLQFSPRAKSNSEYRYKLNHKSDLYGAFEFPDASDSVIGRNDIYIMASSPSLETISKQVEIRSSIVRRNANSCTNNSVTFYEVSGRSWAIRQRFPVAATCTSVGPAKKSYNPTFLAIYKPEPVDQRRTRFRIEYSVAATSVNSCGGNLKAKFGQISYKENGTYSDNERCSWSLEVPEAQSISFYMKRSSFEECCDYVTVSSANTQAIRFSAANRTASVLGSYATVSFVSDGSVQGGGFLLLFNDIAWIRSER